MEQIISNVVREFEQGKISRRQLIRNLAVAVAAGSAVAAKTSFASGAAAEGHGFKAIAVNHISYQVADYAKTRDFYADLLGMQPHNDDGHECYMRFGESVLIPRDRPPNTPRIDHIAYTIENWDKDAVEAELKRRGLNPTPDTEDSFHVRDINGYDLQICGPGMKL
ncbi:MAG TPA: VOC family protein [Candidatus Acidoferrales bacterium]|nr:VOC family protein [Candidatus Acidoferrales bacterium]HEV2314168.1 VOC family protein [Candidatus Acidoferrales bacterium]